MYRSSLLQHVRDFPFKLVVMPLLDIYIWFRVGVSLPSSLRDYCKAGKFHDLPLAPVSGKPIKWASIFSLRLPCSSLFSSRLHQHRPVSSPPCSIPALSGSRAVFTDHLRRYQVEQKAVRIFDVKDVLRKFAWAHLIHQYGIERAVRNGPYGCLSVCSSPANHGGPALSSSPRIAETSRRAQHEASISHIRSELWPRIGRPFAVVSTRCRCS